MTRHSIAIAYLSIGILNIVELAGDPYSPDGLLMNLTTLILASIQAFLLTVTLISLINQSYYTIKKILMELIPVSVCIIVSYLLYLFDQKTVLTSWMYIYSGFFLLQIVRYFLLFKKEYHLAKNKVDNYFSEEEKTNRLKWTAHAIVGILFIALLTLLCLIFPNTLIVSFNIVCIIFYFYFGINYLNFWYWYEMIDTAINYRGEKVQPEELPHSLAWVQMDEAIVNWESSKQFTEPGLTIEQVAIQLKTNRTYLSSYVNTYKKQTFKEWINLLRMDEAKRLMLENPTIPVSQVGAMVGVPDKSNFGRLFSRTFGSSPQSWRDNTGHGYLTVN
ncbi:MAG: helix-turn-helix domain-containing protein [Bacteroidota bacterium]|nr:helix-turn-helix domain-containing protein [Bacteroidota bacterium]